MQTKVSLTCANCGLIYTRTKSHCSKSLKISKNTFCSMKCFGIHTSMNNRQILTCTNCNKTFTRIYSQTTKSDNHFCSQQCSGFYNATHKTKGTRRSKLEKYIEEQLTILYPNLDILYNDKTAINSELDIYIPSLKLAFELNGIFHYEPIYGKETLQNIQNNDNRKFQACLEHGISLCIIDTSKQKYFKKSSSNEFLEIICSIIDGG